MFLPHCLTNPNHVWEWQFSAKGAPPKKHMCLHRTSHKMAPQGCWAHNRFLRACHTTHCAQVFFPDMESNDSGSLKQNKITCPPILWHFKIKTNTRGKREMRLCTSADGLPLRILKSCLQIIGWVCRLKGDFSLVCRVSRVKVSSYPKFTCTCCKKVSNC